MSEPCPSCRRPGCAAQRLPPHADQVTADKVRAFCASHSPPRRGTIVQVIPGMVGQSSDRIGGCLAIVVDQSIMPIFPPSAAALPISIAIPALDASGQRRVLVWANLSEIVVVGFAAFMPEGGNHLGDVVFG